MSDHKMVQADSTEIFLLERLNSLNYAVKENYESVLRMFLTVKKNFKSVFSLFKTKCNYSRIVYGNEC